MPIPTHTSTDATPPEYDHVQHNPPNRLLCDFRTFDGGRGEYGDWLDDIQANHDWWIEQNGAGLMAGGRVGYSADEIRHARMVLTRLANLAEMESQNG